MERALTLFGILCLMTGTLAEGTHIPVQPGKPCVGVLMAGPYRKDYMMDQWTGQHMGAVLARSFYSHMIEPLLEYFRVELMISSDPGESVAWRTWCQPFIPDIYVQITEGAPLPEKNETRFADTFCSIGCDGLWLQYGHLHNSYAMLQQREANDNVRFDYIVKARVDLMYKPDNFMVPGWLFKLSANSVAVPSTEFHAGDRWMERQPSMWPLGMNDQIVFGPRSAMDRYIQYTLEQDNNSKPVSSRSRVCSVPIPDLLQCGCRHG
jgi:hypothetical protein